jgi:integrase
VVSARLGHKHVATTLRIYAHVLRRMSLKAAKTAGDIFGPTGA